MQLYNEEGDCVRRTASAIASTGAPVAPLLILASPHTEPQIIRAAAPTLAAPPPAPDVAEIERALRLFRRPGEVVEIRALHVSTPQYRRPHTVSGYYDDLAQAAQDAAKLSPHSGGVYFTLNPVQPALLARAQNRCRPVDREPLTSDGDVLQRSWLLVDLDAVRPAGISATDAEREMAVARGRAVYRHLATAGWPEPVVADSGNGAHLLYPIDLPTDDRGLVQRTLEALAARFDDSAVTVDTTVFNPARISKLYGTRAGKGDHTPDRPHRLARLIRIPEPL